MVHFSDVIYWGLAAFFLWMVVWGGTMWKRQASDKKMALAWMFLRFEDEHGEKMREVWLQQPGKFALELDSWAMSREMRHTLRGAALDQRPPERTSLLSRRP